MTKQDLHIHSTLDDGSATMEQMVQAAIALGLDSLGFSGHSPLGPAFDQGWFMAPETLSTYRAEFERLMTRYAEKIRLYFGLEYDIFSQMELGEYQYVIGSMHYIMADGVPFSIDDTAPIAIQGVQNCFGGDAHAAAQAYFAQYEQLAENEQIDVVGHFDLLTKFNAETNLFDPEAAGYQISARKAMEQLVDAGKLFEVNTGALARGYRREPYPSRSLLQQLQRMGGRVLLSSDAHQPQMIAYGFAEMCLLLKSCGFQELWQFNGAEFVPTPIP